MKIITNINNLPTNYDILDADNEVICTCKPMTQFDKNKIQFKTYSSAYNQQTGEMQNNIDIETLYDYIFATVIDWNLIDQNDAKIPYSKQNVKKYLDLSLLIYISNKIIQKEKQWIVTNSKN